MKFFKKYILTFFSGIVLAFIFYFLMVFIDKNGFNFSNINVLTLITSGIYFSFYLLLIRVIDDIHDYPFDIIDNKNIFKIRVLYVLLIVFICTLLTFSIILSIEIKYYNLLILIPLILMIINLKLDNEIITLSYLPILGLSYPIFITDSINLISCYWSVRVCVRKYKIQEK